jgi:hypothetical protein
MQATPFPWGGGYVRSAPYLIDCPFACIRPWAPNRVVTLTAIPTPMWTFLGWEVANHGQPQLSGVCTGTGTCTVTMDQAKDVVALFQAPTQPQGVDKPPKCAGQDDPSIKANDGCCPVGDGLGQLNVCCEFGLDAIGEQFCDSRPE